MQDRNNATGIGTAYAPETKDETRFFCLSLCIMPNNCYILIIERHERWNAGIMQLISSLTVSFRVTYP